MLNTLENRFEISHETMKALLISAVIFAVMFAARAFAATGSTNLDDNFSDVWDEMQGIATGNVGKVMMLAMILGGLYFSLMSPNGTFFLACVGGLLVLSNISTIIDGGITATFNDVPNLDTLMTHGLTNAHAAIAHVVGK